MKNRCKPIFIALLTVAISIACNAPSKIKDGRTAYDYKKYALASELLQKDYESATAKNAKSNIALAIARSYDFQNRFSEAENWYKIVADLDHEPEGRFLYGQALKRVEKYAEAMEAFKQYGRLNPTARNKVDAELATCQQALDAKKTDNRIKVLSLNTLNSPGADFQPAMHGGAIYFSSNRTVGEAGQDDWMGNGYADIYMATSSGHRQAGIPSLWNTQINTNYHEGTPVFSADGKTVYFTRCGSEGTTNDYCKIYTSQLNGSQWTEPEVVALMPDTVNCGQPYLANNGLELYFSSDFGSGYGGKDLYVSTRTNDAWSAPVNLGPRVNTAGNEVFPYIASDGKLFFSSDGHTGFGGLDIFMADKQGSMFTNPLRMKYPINSGGDDLGIVVLGPHPDDSVLFSGYMSSNRPGSANDDIYYFEQRVIPPVILPPPVYLLTGTISEPVYATAGDPNSRITGYNPLTGPTVTLTYREISIDKPIALEIAVNPSGVYSTILDQPNNKNYRVDAAKTGYFSANKLFNTRDYKPKDGDTVIIKQDLVLKSIFEKVEIVLNNIYYNLDKWDIREDAKPTLDTLVELLKDNPNLVIELSAHTDSRGSNAYNQTLSQKRAQSVVDYLISKGIDKRRLVAKGYGEERLVNNCKDGIKCTDEEHQQNRRTAFAITSENFKP